VRRRWLSRRRTVRGLRSLDYRVAEGRAANVQYHNADVGFLKVVLLAPFVLVWAVLSGVDLVRAVIAHGRGEPWVIEAERRAMKRTVLTWRVGGWSRSRQAVSEICAALARGHELTSAGEPERSVAR
jgi:hypothetical protein